LKGCRHKESFYDKNLLNESLLINADFKSSFYMEEFTNIEMGDKQGLCKWLHNICSDILGIQSP